ncbi:MAG: nucleoside kinase [Bacteroidota bacterium]|nr:nucleoside kinase [Bacteroidota bacterium]
MKSVEIYCENNQSSKLYPLGTTLLEIAEDLEIELKFPICGALVNNKAKELTYSIVKAKNIRFFDYTHEDGRRIYVRSLIFVLYNAICEVFPQVGFKLEHGISRGYYCELEDLGRNITDDDVFALVEEMKAIIKRDIPFVRQGLPTERVVDIFNQQGLYEKARLYEEQGNIYSYVYFLDGRANYFYGQLFPSTGYLGLFSLERYYHGLLLRIPNPEKINTLMEFDKQDKLFEIFQEHKDWAEIVGVSVIASLNDFTYKKKAGEVIKISEALHERKIVEIANKIYDRRDKAKIVLIAGPSSSGKTTFSKRLAVQLAVSGLKPELISLDNYFVDRERTPKDIHGQYDFEALEAIDIDFFNQNLIDLMNGEEIVLPRFDFKTGSRYFNGDKLKLKKNGVIIIEGIHALNPQLIPHINPENTFKIFISALTQISIDFHNHIPTTDNRLIRRIIRDNKYRNYSCLDTIRRWTSVRKGEEKNIFPFQENADIMFNSSQIYELGVLKKYVEPMLSSIPENQPEYNEAVRLLSFLSYIRPIDDAEIPPTSLLREFLGGSRFAY